MGFFGGLGETAAPRNYDDAPYEVKAVVSRLIGAILMKGHDLGNALSLVYLKHEKGSPKWYIMDNTDGEYFDAYFKYDESIKMWKMRPFAGGTVRILKQREAEKAAASAKIRAVSKYSDYI